jgi:SsrA-binding protein
MSVVDPKPQRLIAENRKARHEFEMLETVECGIALQGTEVKSLRGGKCSIAEAFGLVRGGELWLVGAHIAEYTFGNVHNHAPLRDRKLLLHKRQLAHWDALVREKGVTIVPLSIYFVGARVKVQMALARGRKLHDKREREREKTDQRDIDRAMSRRRRDEG